VSGPLRWRPVRPTLLDLALLGFAAFVYGVASLSGCWLGRPPWWGQWVPSRESEMGGNSLSAVVEAEIRREYPDRPEPVDFRWSWDLDSPTGGESYYLRPYREWVSAGVALAGLGVLAFGLWPRRRRDASC
jgi:hypothetical protein